MPYFEQMYEAALKKDDVTFQKFLDQGACIDEREDNEGFNSVAGTLAKQGHIDCAMRLVNKFGAGVGFVIYGLLQGSFKDEAIRLATQFGIEERHLNYNQFTKFSDECLSYYEWFKAALDPQNVEILVLQPLSVLSHAGHIQEISEAVERHRKAILNNAAHGGHIFFLEKEYTKKPQLTQTIGYWFTGHRQLTIGSSAFRFQTAALARHSFTFLKNEEFRKALLTCLSPYNLPYDIGKIEKEADKVRELMSEYQLDYNQAYKWLTEPDTRTWVREIAMSDTAKVPLPSEMKQKISSYLLGFSDEESTSFHTKIQNISAKLQPKRKSPGFFSESLATTKNTEVMPPPPKKQRISRH